MSDQYPRENSHSRSSSSGSSSSSSSSTSSSTSTETIIVPNVRPEECVCGPDLYGTVIGPTADESILLGLQTLFKLGYKCTVGEIPHPSPSVSPGTTSASKSSNSKPGGHRRYRKRRGTHTQRASYASGGTYSSTGSFTGGEETDIDEPDPDPDSVPISVPLPLVSTPEASSIPEIIQMQEDMPASVHPNPTASSSHAPSHHSSSHHEKSHHSSKNSSPSAHSANKSLHSTTTNKTSKTTKTNKTNKTQKRVDPGQSNYTLVHKKHHKHRQHHHHKQHGYGHHGGQHSDAEAEGGDCCGSCRCRHLPPVCTVIPEICPADRTITTYAEGSQTLRSCYAERSQTCQTSTSANSDELDSSESSDSDEGYEHHNGHSKVHHGNKRHSLQHPQHHPSSPHLQHHRYSRGRRSRGYDPHHRRMHSPHHPAHYDEMQHTKPNHVRCLCPKDVVPSVYEESDDESSCYCCSSTPQSTGGKNWRSVSWRSYTSPDRTSTSCSCESRSKLSKATSFLCEKVSKANSCFCKSLGIPTPIFTRKPSKSTCICECEPCMSKRNVICCCQAQMTSNNDQKEETEEKPPNDAECSCTSVQKISDCASDKDVRYAITKITKFDKYTTFEVLQSTKRKPKSMPGFLEGVFVLKNEAE